MRIPARQQANNANIQQTATRRQVATVASSSSNSSQNADADSDAFIMSEEGVGTRLYTAKLLLERLYGEVTKDCTKPAKSKTQPQTQVSVQPTTRPSPSMSVGQNISLSQVQTQAIDITWQHSQQVTFTLQTETQRLEVTATQTETGHLRIEAVQAQEADPLVFDLAGDGVNLRSVEDPVSFDIDGDGAQELTGFVQDDDAILALRPEGNESLSGVDFIGNRPGAVNGFEELHRLDSNFDGQINASDEAWEKLVLVQDSNNDREISTSEIMTLEKAGIKSISTGYSNLNEQNNGQRLIAAGEFSTAEGTGRIVDAMLLYRETANVSGA